MVTASMDVVPNKTDKAITPGSNSRTSTGVADRIININDQEMGKIIPQLILGGFR
jgi:hypothetical protein